MSGFVLYEIRFQLSKARLFINTTGVLHSQPILNTKHTVVCAVAYIDFLAQQVAAAKLQRVQLGAAMQELLYGTVGYRVLVCEAEYFQLHAVLSPGQQYGIPHAETRVKVPELY
jgi:hypothetical protein